jgi:hypothetical protein
VIASAWSGRLAQLVRAPALQAGGRRFESCTAHHTNQSLPCALPVPDQFSTSWGEILADHKIKARVLTLYDDWEPLILWIADCLEIVGHVYVSNAALIELDHTAVIAAEFHITA